MKPDRTMSTPSLVGDSVRGVDDSHRGESRGDPIDNATSSSMILNKIQPQDISVDNSYTTVAELNREGALLTDEMDMDQVINATDKAREDSDKHRRWLKTLKKKQEAQARDHANSSNNDSDNFIVNGAPGISPVKSSESKSFTSLADTSEDQIDFSPRRKSRGTIRNCHGQFIRDSSNRPHLANGQSYQSAGNAAGPEPLPAEEKEERSGRRSVRTLDSGSREYLRSLSRSLSRDPAARRGNQQPSTTEAAGSLENARLYSTNNYSISQADLENAPHIIQTLKEEPEEPEELRQSRHKHYGQAFGAGNKLQQSSENASSNEHVMDGARHL